MMLNEEKSSRWKSVVWGQKLLVLLLVVMCMVYTYVLNGYMRNETVVSQTTTQFLSSFYPTYPMLLKELGNHIFAMRLVEVQPITEDRWKKVRVLCWVNTYHKNHMSHAVPIRETWGKKCDKIVFMSDVEDERVPTVRVIAPPTHDALWVKHRGVLRTLYREYYGQYDWIFKCDDDTFVLMENLKGYLTSPEIASIPKDKPTLLGHRMTLQYWAMRRPFMPLEEHWNVSVELMNKMNNDLKDQGGLYYTPGGGGYAFNWAYLKEIMESLDKPHCLPGDIVPDDWAISFCMYPKGVIPRDTRDSQKRERFHQYSPERVYFEQHDENLYNHKYFNNVYEDMNWFSDHAGLGWQNGTNCCAPDTISFHYVKPPMMYLVNSFYYQGVQQRMKPNQEPQLQIKG